MKTSIFSALLALLCLATSCSKNDSTNNSETTLNNNEDYVKYCEDLDLAKQTQLYVKEHWKNIINTDVTWTGRVYDVRASRSTATIYIDKEARPTYKGYNVTLQVADLEKAGQLKKKQRIRFKGQITNYKASRGGIIIFTLVAGEILEVID